MTTRKVFRYRIDFTALKPPLSASNNFADSFRQMVSAMGCELFSNGLMNWIDHSEGLVFRESGTITHQEREKIINWIVGQRFSGSLVVGDLEDYDRSTVVGTFDGEHYEIDNTTPLQSD